jgi:hypothetical protein
MLQKIKNTMCLIRYKKFNQTVVQYIAGKIFYRNLKLKFSERNSCVTSVGYKWEGGSVAMQLFLITG